MSTATSTGVPTSRGCVAVLSERRLHTVALGSSHPNPPFPSAPVGDGLPELGSDGLNARMLERFWSKVNKDGPIPEHRPDLGPCWEWTACCYDNGYGMFWDGERNVRAHRFAFELECGPIPVGRLVLHHCDNRPCIRPGHLFDGTHRDNAQDAISKDRFVFASENLMRGYGCAGRSYPGESNPAARLRVDDVRRIRELYAGGGYTHIDLAGMFNVSRWCIGELIRRHTWNHV